MQDTAPKVVMTPHKQKKIARDNSIFEEYTELVSQGGMATAVTDVIMKKYGISARSTIWSILKKVRSQREAGLND